MISLKLAKILGPAPFDLLQIFYLRYSLLLNLLNQNLNVIP